MRQILTLSFLVIGLVLAGNLWSGEAADLLLKKICQETCSGKMSWIQTWNDGERKTKVYQYQGDLTACSHPPQIFYEAGGQKLGFFPEFPVNPQDSASMAKLKEIQEKRAEWLKGLSPGKKLWCDSLSGSR